MHVSTATTSPPPPTLTAASKLPLAREDYLKHRDATIAAYTSSITEYDRLVTWASAGALGVSISFLEKFGTNADRRTAWMLATAWGLLAASFGLSLWSQYTSSRLHSWRRQELDHCQTPIEERKHEWQSRAARLEKSSRRYGKATRWMTFLSGIALVGGIVSIAAFAFLNAPFRDPATGVSVGTTIEPEKRGLDYTPPPVPPTSTTTSAPAPATSGPAPTTPKGASNK